MGSIVGVDLGLLVGFVPTVSMLISSYALTSITVSKNIEATFQNFAAGLIIAAVSSELFPLILDGVSKENSWIGITVGFTIGLSLLNGLEMTIEYIIGAVGEEDKYVKTNTDFPMTQIISKLKSEEPASAANDSTLTNSEPLEVLGDFLDHKALSMDSPDWEEAPVLAASLAISTQPEHRHHLNEHVLEIVQEIRDMESKCRLLFNEQLSQRETEALAEQIDEKTHHLQYKLDHCRRLLQGSETESSNLLQNSWVTDEKKRAMRRRLELLRATGEHIAQEHLSEEHISPDSLKEMHQHMSDMDLVIDSFHRAVETAGSRWTRRMRDMPSPALGDTLPVGLVVPVTLDCFSDGFLIGVSCALSPSAGIVLGFANCLEMGFLGMAYSVRLKNCTGSSLAARQAALICPPLLMCLSAGLGAELAYAARNTPAVFVGFVSFGVVALLSLVCEELLIEARESQGDNPAWYVQVALYAAVYLVLMVYGSI